MWQRVQLILQLISILPVCIASLIAVTISGCTFPDTQIEINIVTVKGQHSADWIMYRTVMQGELHKCGQYKTIWKLSA